MGSPGGVGAGPVLWGNEVNGVSWVGERGKWSQVPGVGDGEGQGNN